jgi:hypothetical protein
MPGIKALRKLQFGRESTAGTIVPATTVWRGIGTLEDAREPVFPAEDIGYLSGTSRSYIPKVEGALDLESVEATFEQLPHILEMGIKTATPSQDGTGSGYIYQYDFPTTAAPTIKTYTIEGGDNQEAEVMEYCYVSEFTLEGNAGEAWMMSANIVGRQVALQGFTGSVAVPTVEDMLFQKSKLYIDAIGGTWGSTLKSNTLLNASLNYTTGIIPKYTADGNLYFSFIQYTQPEVRLTVTFEHDGTAATEKVNWRNQTPRLIRLLIQGSTFTTAGTSYTMKTGIIDLAGKWESFQKLGDQDGNDVIEAEFVARYDATAAKFGKILVVTNLSALP